MVQFDVTKTLLKRLNIIANEDLFSMMLNYIIRKKGLSDEELTLLKDRWHILKKRYPEDETKKKKNYKEFTEFLNYNNSYENLEQFVIHNELEVLKYIKEIYIREFPFIDLSNFLLSLDLFEYERYTTKIKNRDILINFLEYLKMKYNLNNFIDLLANQDIVSKEAINNGGNYLLKDLNYLFAQLGLTFIQADNYYENLKYVGSYNYMDDAISFYDCSLIPFDEETQKEYEDCYKLIKKINSIDNIDYDVVKKYNLDGIIKK
jgi:hypothetical protein